MNKTLVALIALCLAAPVSSWAQAKSLTEIVDEASGALATFSCTIDDELAERTVSGQAICIDPTGVFMTIALSGDVRIKTLKDFRLTLPGIPGKTLKAALEGIDPATGIAFIRATEQHTWKVVRFAPKAPLAVGQPVVSVGLLPADLGNMPYLGTAVVSARIRVPGEMVRVTGGDLTVPGSPVFAMDGRAIGIVGRQLPSVFQVFDANGRSNLIRMSGQQETGYFLPVEEFVNVLRDPPRGGSIARLPWIGAAAFKAITKDLADVMKLDRPAVEIDRVVEGQPGAAAGLKDRDIVVAVDGQPLEQMATPELVRDNFVRNLFRMKPDQSVTLTVLRAGKTQDLKIKLGAMPEQPHEAARYVARALGFIIRDKVIMDQYLSTSEAAKADGLVVMLVAQNSPAAAGGLRPGDLITTINDQPVKTVAAFENIVDTAIRTKPLQAVNLLVRRGDQAQAVSIQPPTKR